jgi:hypothetical protein
MQTGDEGRPMSILEFISDEPLDPEPYIDYLIDHYKAHREYWLLLPSGPRSDDKPTTRDCVITKIDFFLIELDNIKRKMHRPTPAH